MATITEKEQFLRQNRTPKLKDIELIAMNLTAEYMGIDSECQLFRDIPAVLFSKIERSVYNKRKRKLFFAIEFIRTQLSHYNDVLSPNIGEENYTTTNKRRADDKGFIF